ncbi:hypothetical protein AMELA_G00007080 [Ameiurus melas]|uniref:Transcription factor HES-5 n=1 Tax=Ameiurus melas TaxID=219545 RepID=A0A7J6BI09_AMEME|nr:hypothetical protein AMELA_G00007080 [Ameiurus melas]
MAPTITSAMAISNKHLPLNNKLRKPMVEKMRRDRINSSIEQLKSLLSPEFLNQQPDSKLEKEDILEMIVSLLRQLPAFSCSSAAVIQGFSRCVNDVVHFLSKEELRTQSQRTTSRIFSHHHMRTGGKVSCLSGALQSNRSSAKRRVQLRAPWYVTC